MSRRLSKKLKIGKKYFQRCPERPMGEEHIAKHREAQKRLSDLEEVGTPRLESTRFRDSLSILHRVYNHAA